jgi:CBS domain-containing protein
LAGCDQAPSGPAHKIHRFTYTEIGKWLSIARRRLVENSFYRRHSTEEKSMQKIMDVMSRDVQVIGPDSSIQDAAQRMLKGNFGMLPVEENDRMIGAISDRDIAIRAVAAGRKPDEKVRNVMSEGIVWAFENDSIADAAKRMSDHQIRRLPVVNADKRLVGIVALGDFAVVSADIEVAGKALSKISKAA